MLIILGIVGIVIYLRKGKDEQSGGNSKKSKSDEKLMDDIKPNLIPNNN